MFSSPKNKGASVRIIIVFLLLISIRYINAQEREEKLFFSGYVSTLQNAQFQKLNGFWVTDNLIHNRLNFKYLFNENLSSAVELRNRVLFGESITLNPLAAEMYSSDNGFVDLTRNVAKGKSYLVNSNIDRAWISYEKEKLKVTIGRQRINWGQTFAWNPNDIFNAYSFFDFDYVERPGSDAIRVQYYNSEVSSTEAAFKLNAKNKITAAALHRFNRFEYDFQFLGGILEESDYVIGFAWSGAIKSMSFRGEASYFQPVKETFDTSGITMYSVSADYTFSNSLTLMAEYLYSNNKVPDNVTFLEFYNAPLTVKNLSFVKHSIVVQASYPLTPLINTNLALMYLPGVDGYYIGPGISYNLAENVDASIFYQGFSAEIAQTTQRFHLLFLRLKWSF